MRVHHTKLMLTVSLNRAREYMIDLVLTATCTPIYVSPFASVFDIVDTLGRLNQKKEIRTTSVPWVTPISEKQ